MQDKMYISKPIERIIVSVDATEVLAQTGNLYTQEPAYFYAVRACNHTWSNRLLLWLMERKGFKLRITEIDNQSEDEYDE